MKQVKEMKIRTTTMTAMQQPSSRASCRGRVSTRMQRWVGQGSSTQRTWMDEMQTWTKCDEIQISNLHLAACRLMSVAWSDVVECSELSNAVALVF